MSVQRANRESRKEQADREMRRRRRLEMLGTPDSSVGPSEPIVMEMAQVMAGVTLTWLAYVFKRDRNTAKILLTDCPVLRHGPGGAPIYNVAEAAMYLVKPKLDVKKILSTMKESDLPDELKPKIWDARLKQQRWLDRAGDLWKTADVIAVFGDALKEIKGKVNLWTDDVAEETGLTEKQRDIITAKSDELLATLHKALVDMSAKKSTRSQAAALDPDRDEDE